MTTTIYSGDMAARATGADYLDKRIEINKAYSSIDFDSWLLERLGVRPGEDVLDVGCGSGAQTVPIALRVGPTGSVSALDISADSVARVQSKTAGNTRVQAVVADMADLAPTIANVFRVKRYDLAQSTYALYYSKDRAHVLDVMRGALKPGGRCAVFTPNAPHGLVDLAARFTRIPAEIGDCMVFGPQVLKPYFDRNFARVDVHHFHNDVTLPSADKLLEFYRQTTYYDPAAEAPMRAHVEAEIRAHGAFRYEKNGYLIIGTTHG